MNDNFTPNMGTYTNLTPFRFWCQKVLPLTYDNSLSYYELLCKVVDYLNKTMEDVDTAIEDMEKLYDAYDELQAFVTDYFDNLDIEAELTEILDEMAEDGRLDAIIGTYITPITDELNSRIASQDSDIALLSARVDEISTLPEGSTSGDAELADIRVGFDGYNYTNAGNAVREQTETNSKAVINMSANVLDFEHLTEHDSANIHYEYFGNGYFHRAGTASSTSFWNVMSHRLGMPWYCKAGDYLYIDIREYGGSVLVNHVYFYDINNEQISDYTISQPNIVQIPDNANGFIFRTSVSSGNTTDTDFRLLVHVIPAGTTEVTLNPIPPTMYGNGLINAALIFFKTVNLSPAVYQTSSGSTITMQAGRTLNGNGATIMKESSYPALRLADRCTVRDITFKGSDTQLTVSENDTGQDGIIWDTPDSHYAIVESCRFENFAGAGIRLLDTGTPIDCGIQVSNCSFQYCNKGIFVQRDSEFNKFVNCTIVRCWTGYYNRGGNNDLCNCGIDANHENVVIDDAEGSNGGHGTITGCSFNHAGHNNGYALIIRGTGRMLISNCNFYYGKLRFEDTNGNVLSGCGFGRLSGIEIEDGECTLFNGCMFRSSSDSPVTRTNNTKAKFINCFDREGVQFTA